MSKIVVTSNSPSGLNMSETSLLYFLYVNSCTLVSFSKPTTFATINRGSIVTYFFALPGNPVSALVTFYLFALPAIRKLAGFKKPHLQRIQARVSNNYIISHN